jgi:hypothetical protein
MLTRAPMRVYRANSSCLGSQIITQNMHRRIAMQELCVQGVYDSSSETQLSMLSAHKIAELHDSLAERWHISPENVLDDLDDWMKRVALQHRANFDLWHIEDEARSPGATDADLADVKRRVDMTNQKRNDLAEDLDRMLLEWLAARQLPNPVAPLHSESPGLIIDRLSIMALKIYHTREEAERENAPEGHGERNLHRLEILEEQRADLADCLDSLWRETVAGARRFKLYRQLKMYNDPTLNPAIYGKSANE